MSMLRQKMNEQGVTTETLLDEKGEKTASNLEELIDSNEQWKEEAKLDQLVETHLDPVCPGCGERHPLHPLQMLFMKIFAEMKEQEREEKSEG